MQFAIDFNAKLSPTTQIGMAAADDHADYRWKRVTDAAILAVARRKAEFTVDDILDELSRIPDAPSTHNLAAIGPRMKEVSKVMRYMTASNRVQRSKRKEKNGNLHRIWLSNLFVKEQP